MKDPTNRMHVVTQFSKSFRGLLLLDPSKNFGHEFHVFPHWSVTGHSSCVWGIRWETWKATPLMQQKWGHLFQFERPAFPQGNVFEWLLVQHWSWQLSTRDSTEVGLQIACHWHTEFTDGKVTWPLKGMIVIGNLIAGHVMFVLFSCPFFITQLDPSRSQAPDAAQQSIAESLGLWVAPWTHDRCCGMQYP